MIAKLIEGKYYLVSLSKAPHLHITESQKIIVANYKNELKVQSLVSCKTPLIFINKVKATISELDLTFLPSLNIFKQIIN